MTGALVDDGERALPLGIAWVAFGKSLPDREALLVGCRRLLALAGIGEHISDSDIPSGEIGLPFDVAGIADDKLLVDRLALVEMLERLVEPAGMDQSTADPATSNRHVPLGIGIGL